MLTLGLSNNSLSQDLILGLVDNKLISLLCESLIISFFPLPKHELTELLDFFFEVVGSDLIQN